MENKLAELKTRLREINDVQSAAAILTWDQSTYMPPGGAPARARQSATLQRLAHEKLTDPAIGKLLDELQPHAENLPYDSDDAALVRVARRAYERAVKVPPEFMGRFVSHMGEAYSVWAQARPENDFGKVQPYLEQTLDYSRQLADFFPGYQHPADPLIDFSDYGMRAETVREVFGELREQLVPLVQAILEQEPVDNSCLHRDFPEPGQEAFFTEVIKDFGYDYQRGRQDVSPHPFTVNFSINDVRITVRYKRNDLGEALFSGMHEAGHAMYEQGISQEYEGTLLASGTSSGVHESQSRLWENIVGRSWPFWQHYYAKLVATFPEQLDDVSSEEFYRAINKVQRSLIRTDADEVTYNLHVMLRFDFELAMLEGELPVRDLPEAWNERFRSDLGITPPSYSDGVMQDVHWFGGTVGGAFQGYTLGNIMSAQFYEAALQVHPEIPEEIRAGRFGVLHSWLRDKLYQHGSKFTAPELLERVTGADLHIGPYMRYLRGKYSDIYGLELE